MTEKILGTINMDGFGEVKIKKIADKLLAVASGVEVYLGHIDPNLKVEIGDISPEVIEWKLREFKQKLTVTFVL